MNWTSKLFTVIVIAAGLGVLVLIGATLYTNYKLISELREFQNAYQVAATVNPDRVVTTPLPVPNATPVIEKSNCPTTDEAKKLTGVDVQRLGTEPCAFVWRGTPNVATAVCPMDWVCTWDTGESVIVQLGEGQRASIEAGTWRFINAYPKGDAVYDVCALFEKEKNFGLSEISPFQVEFKPASIGPQTCP